MTIPIQLTTPSVLYMETGSNFLLDFIKVGVKVAEGTWIGEQRSRVNFLRLILDPGTHYIKILNAHSKNTYHMEHEIKNQIDVRRTPERERKKEQQRERNGGNQEIKTKRQTVKACSLFHACSSP